MSVSAGNVCRLLKAGRNNLRRTTLTGGARVVWPSASSPSPSAACLSTTRPHRANSPFQGRCLDPRFVDKARRIIDGLDMKERVPGLEEAPEVWAGDEREASGGESDGGDSSPAASQVAVAPSVLVRPPDTAASGSGPIIGAAEAVQRRALEVATNALQKVSPEHLLSFTHHHQQQQPAQNLASAPAGQPESGDDGDGEDEGRDERDGRRRQRLSKSVLDFGLSTDTTTKDRTLRRENIARDEIITDIEAIERKSKSTDAKEESSLNRHPTLDFSPGSLKKRLGFHPDQIATALARLKRRLLGQAALNTGGTPLERSDAEAKRKKRLSEQEGATADRVVPGETRPVPIQVGASGYFSRILARFPVRGRTLVFAYGSGVFSQTGQNVRDNMTDVIIVVEDAFAWHQANMRMNARDYSSMMRLLGPRFVSYFQDAFGARMYFNTLIPFEKGKIKYGVISRSAFLTDLLDWEHLYVCGRLHKPVRMMEVDADREWELTTALRLNLQSAMHTALLLLPETFSEENLYTTLTGLSYTGDFRMHIGEDKNKVINIVRPNMPRFRQLYAGRLRSMSDYVDVSPARGRGDQDTSAAARHFHLSQLPRQLQWRLVQEWNADGRHRDVEEVLRAAAYDRDSEDLLRKALGDIVARASVSQAWKGVATAGIRKTITYSKAKLNKMKLSKVGSVIESSGSKTKRKF